LYWFPIIHTPEDLGSVRESVRRLYLREVGQDYLENHERRVAELWNGIRAAVGRLNLDFARVRLYQDGLPVFGKEEQVVRDLAGAGSRNHALLLDLMARGAALEGTESPELLMREYALTRQLLDSQSLGRFSSSARRGEQLGREILHQRDQFIADQIGRTLKPGETGLLFLGMLHSLAGLLPPDIELRRVENLFSA
jgi:hypothetical protein